VTRREPFILEAGRSGRIRTCDPLVPNEVRYQTAPHSASASRRRYSRQNRGLQARSGIKERGEKALYAVHAGCTAISMPVCSAAFRGSPSGACLLGRSQVVRQRILIPPFGGSSPPAPAKKTSRNRKSLFATGLGLAGGRSYRANNRPVLPCPDNLLRSVSSAIVRCCASV
jgi:hypothetical protein